MKKSIEFRGRVYESITLLAKEKNVDYRNLARRLSSGWSLEEALGEKKRKKKGSRGRTIKIEGISFSTLKTAAQHYNIEPGNLQARLMRGWSPEEAVGLKRPPEKKRGNPKPLTFLGKKFNSYQERNAYYGLDERPQNVERRIARGWTERQAVGLDPLLHAFATRTEKQETTPGETSKLLMGLHILRHAKESTVYTKFQIQ